MKTDTLEVSVEGFSARLECRGVLNGGRYMRTPTVWIAAFAASVLLMGENTQAGDIALDKVPKVVMDAVQARIQDGKVSGAAKVKDPESGKEVYEISMDRDGMNVDLTVSPEGAISLVERQITRKELPAPVAAMLQEKYPKSKYRVIEEATAVNGAEDKLLHYEVMLMTPEKQLRAVRLDLEGKILKDEKQTPEEDD